MRRPGDNWPGAADEFAAPAESYRQHAFAELTGTYQGELRSYCYRMLGSVQDAEDAVQNALLRAWRGLDKFEVQGHEALRAWLVRDPLTMGWRHRAARANGQLAVAGYLLDPQSGRYPGHVIDVLTLDGDKIAAVTAFLPGDEAAADTFAAFGLPPELP